MLVATAVVAILAAIVCLAAVVLTGGRISELREENAALRRQLRAAGRPLNQHADDALALTVPAARPRQWVDPSAAQLAQWAQRPGRDWTTR